MNPKHVEALAQYELNKQGLGQWKAKVIDLTGYEQARSAQENRPMTIRGVCHQDKKEIHLDLEYVETGRPHNIYNTIYHEVAHALHGLQPIKNHHNAEWITMAKQLGATQELTITLQAKSKVGELYIKKYGVVWNWLENRNYGKAEGIIMYPETLSKVELWMRTDEPDPHFEVTGHKWHFGDNWEGEILNDSP